MAGRRCSGNITREPLRGLACGEAAKPVGAFRDGTGHGRG